MGAQGGKGGDRQSEEEQNGVFMACGGTIGHCPLWGCCPKAIIMSKTVFKGLLDETLCNLLGCIQAEQYRFSLVHLRKIIVYVIREVQEHHRNVELHLYRKVCLLVRPSTFELS